jgi:hypothetical protein
MGDCLEWLTEGHRGMNTFSDYEIAALKEILLSGDRISVLMYIRRTLSCDLRVAIVIEREILSSEIPNLIGFGVARALIDAFHALQRAKMAAKSLYNVREVERKFYKEYTMPTPNIDEENATVEAALNILQAEDSTREERIIASDVLGEIVQAWEDEQD